MQIISGAAADCRERARVMRLRALIEPNPESRADFEDMERRWLNLAQSFEFAEKISGYLEWQAQRLRPVDCEQ